MLLIFRAKYNSEKGKNVRISPAKVLKLYFNLRFKIGNVEGIFFILENVLFLSAIIVFEK